MRIPRLSKGFTLFELLVVIGIIGLLSTLAVVALTSVRQKTRDAKRVADVRSIRYALELYFNDQNTYPSHGSGANIILGGANSRTLCGGTASGASGWKASCASGDTVYMGLVPAASVPADGSCSDAQNDFTYIQTSTTAYTLNFCIGGAVGELAGGARVANPDGMQ
jgi:prepilin-type N-terminal cleavage/methylation domain-containing protein